MTDADLNDLVAWVRTQGTGGVVAQASEAISASSLRASDLDARHNICASLKKLYQELSPQLRSIASS
jgi:hypothetical protein